MATHKVTFINESEGLNTTIEVPDDEYIRLYRLNYAQPIAKCQQIKQRN